MDISQKQVAFTIAGSDSGGGAGIQTDLRTFHAFGVFGTSAITAVTAQNPLAVRGISAIPPEIVSQQIAAVEDTIAVSAAKTGMLFSSEIILAVADAIRQVSHPVIVDPVMVSTSGARLLRTDAIQTMMQALLPLATWVTPNIPEAELLTGRTLDSSKKYRDAAIEISEKWGLSVVLKGGHAESDSSASDIVFHEGRLYRLSTPRLEVKPHADHGTGCTFCAAFTAAIARGESICHALVLAKAFVTASLDRAVSIGRPGHPIYAMYPPLSFEDTVSHIQLEEI